uniref:Uncharacterized protein n=1 Tax=Strigamia maritima TaxID=126957 RepID=T1JHP4_STRMM
MVFCCLVRGIRYQGRFYALMLKRFKVYDANKLAELEHRVIDAEARAEEAEEKIKLKQKKKGKERDYESASERCNYVRDGGQKMLQPKSNKFSICQHVLRVVWRSLYFVTRIYCVAKIMVKTVRIQVLAAIGLRDQVLKGRLIKNYMFNTTAKYPLHRILQDDE